MINIVTALYHFLSLVVPIGKKLHSLSTSAAAAKRRRSEMQKVFISYSSGDSDFAELARLQLQQRGIEVWLDQGALHPGDDWRKSIDEGISSSDALIVVLSPRSSMSSYVTFEWAYA